MRYLNRLNIISVVKKILEKYPRFRDDDRALFAFIQRYQIKRWNKKCEPSEVVASYDDWERAWVGEKRFAHFSTVMRSRQALQLKYPHLRGKKYDERHRIEKPLWEQDLRNIENGSTESYDEFPELV